MQSTLQEYPNRNRKLIYIFIWSLRWIIFCRSLSLYLSLFLCFSRWFLLEWFCHSIAAGFFWCVAFFIQWIAKAESNRMNTKFTFGKETHTHTQMIVQSCKWKENKDKAKKYTLVYTTDTFPVTKSAGNHTQHKWYELQNNSIEKE